MARKEAQAASAFEIVPTTMVPYERLNPAPYNPRTITPRQLEALKEGIKEHGFLDPLVVQKSSMTILGGHQRYRAVKEICVEEGKPIPELPCLIIDVDDRKAKRINVALNKVSGEFDARLLGELLSDVNHEAPIGEPDLLLMGFEDRDELATFLAPEGNAGLEGTAPAPTTRAPSLNLDFESRELRDAVKAAIAAKSKGEEPSGATLARMLAIKASRKSVA